MATTAAQVTGPDTEYVETNSAQTTRLRPWRLKDRATFRTNAHRAYHALFETGSGEGQITTAGTTLGKERVTRALNILVAGLGLLITAPLLLLIAVAVKLSSRGPVFYKHTRIGLDRRWKGTPSHEDSRIHDLGGRPFTMFKFRTMVEAAESDKKEVWATPRDTRVTSLGRHLRHTRLDELAQLFNVLAGDMNMVGPRPERPTIFAELREVIPNYHMRQRVRPGITGWAQVNLAYDTSVDDVRRKVEYDLEYLSTRSPSRDLGIMARTVPIMLFCRLGW